jgi:hypothetical protein
MKTTRYAVSFIDHKGERGLVTKNSNFVTLDAMPLHSTETNAKRAVTYIMNRLDKTLAFRKLLVEEVSDGSDRWDPVLAERTQKYLDTLQIKKNGLEIVPIFISICIAKWGE